MSNARKPRLTMREVLLVLEGVVLGLLGSMFYDVFQGDTTKSLDALMVLIVVVGVVGVLIALSIDLIAVNIEK